MKVEPQPGRHLLTSWLRVGGIGIAAIVCWWFAFVEAVIISVDSDAPILLMFMLVTFGLPVALWSSNHRDWRSIAVVVAVCWVLVGLVGAWITFWF
jgi:hypothetical protein